MGSRRAADRFAGLPMAQGALAFASARHAGQYREIDRAPFITHPIEVGRLLHRDGLPDDVIAAGLLHDVLERTETTCVELDRRFGTCVGRLVRRVSDDPSIGDYEERKRELRDRVERADSDTFAIFAADKIANVRELALLPPWRLHDGSTRAKLAHYRASLEMFRRVAGDLRLVERLDDELTRLVAPSTAGLTATAPIRAPRTPSTATHRARTS
jgi:(p)ppGpp synthase/HD superfamily hydrolase